MEDKKLNEQESLELIAQMIRNTKTRVKKNGGLPFLIWGYTTVVVSILVWYVVVSTRRYEWQCLWFLLPAVSCTLTYFMVRKDKEPVVKTFVDQVIKYIWMIFGWTVFLVSCLGMIRQMPILFLILLLLGMGTMLTGLIVRFKPVIIGGLFGMLSSLLCLWLEGTDQILAFAPAFIFMMIIPGHIMNRMSSK